MKSSKLILWVAIPLAVVLIVAIIFMYNPGLYKNIFEEVIFADNFEYIDKNYSVYISEKSGNINISVYANDNFLKIPQEVGLGSDYKDMAHYILNFTGVKNEKPYTEAIHLNVIKSDNGVIEGDIIITKEFGYKGDKYKLVYSK